MRSLGIDLVEPAPEILRLAFVFAELAVIRGFHRAEFDQVGPWETVVGRLAREPPLLGLPGPP